MSTSAPRRLDPNGAGFELCDITDLAALSDVVARHRIDRIIHTAAMLSTGIRQNPVRGVSVNVIGTANVLECARQAQVGRVVCASSTTVAYTVFGDHGAEPVVEDEPMRLVSQRPASIYAATKIAAENLALLYRDLYGLDAVCLRYGAVIGGALDAPTSVPGRLLARLAEGGRSGRKSSSTIRCCSGAARRSSSMRGTAPAPTSAHWMRRRRGRASTMWRPASGSA